MLIHKVHSPHHTGIACPPIKAVYNPKASIPHAASLHQACAHCAIFPTAASRRSLGRISVPMWPVALLGRLPVDALVGHHPTNKLIGRDPIIWHKSFPNQTCIQLEHWVLPPVSRSYPQPYGRLVTHYSPVRHSHHQTKAQWIPFDLHVLSTPPAFVLSQNQTLHTKTVESPTQAHKKNKKTTSKTTPHHKAERSLTQTNTHTPSTNEKSTGILLAIKNPTKNHTPQKGRSLQSDHNLQKHISIKVVQNTLLSSQTTTTHTRTHPHTGSTPQQAATKNNTPPTPPHTTPACRTPHTHQTSQIYICISLTQENPHK